MQVEVVVVVEGDKVGVAGVVEVGVKIMEGEEVVEGLCQLEVITDFSTMLMFIFSSNM